MEKKPIKGLKISKGTKSVSPVNKAFKRRKKQVLTVADYLQGIRSGNRVILSRAITLVESKSPKHQAQAQAIIEACLPYSGNSIRIGITGTPGVGKSTFIEQFGGLLIQKKHKVASFYWSFTFSFTSKLR